MNSKVLVLILMMAYAAPLANNASYLDVDYVSNTTSSTPPTSDYVEALSYQIGNGAVILDIIEHNSSYAMLITHSGNGQIGSQSWTGQSDTHAIMLLQENGSLSPPYHFTPHAQPQIFSTNQGLLTVSNDSGIVNLSLHDIQSQQVSSIEIGSSSNGPFNLLAIDAEGDNVALVVRCYVQDSSSTTLDGDECATTSGRYNLTTYSVDLSSQSVTHRASVGWLNMSTSSVQYGTKTGSLDKIISPSPDCEQFIYLHPNGAMDSLATTDCATSGDWNTFQNVDTSVSLFGSTSDWSPDDFSDWGIAMTASTMDNGGVEYYDGWKFGAPECSYDNLMKLVPYHFGHSMVFKVIGWTTGSPGQQCSIDTHDENDGSSTNEILKQRWLNSDALVIGDRRLNASTTDVLSTTKDLLGVAVGSTSTIDFISICHTGSLTNDATTVASGSTTERNSILAWRPSGILNVTVLSASAGCVSHLAASSMTILALHDDASLQELTLLAADSDGDTYADINDAFPLDSNQWSDGDGDGYGDNPGFTSSDDCPLAYGNSSQGKRGCTDSDGDTWADVDDKFVLDPTQWADSDNDGYGDNTSGNYGDDCPNQSGTSTQDRRGCPDQDFDGFSDANDDYPNNPAQWKDSDGDGFGDNSAGAGGDDCPETYGSSTIELQGCPDADGDNYADIIDALPYDPSQQKDLDGDGYGDNPNGTNPDQFRFDPTQHNDTDGDGYGDNIGGTRGDSCPNTFGNSTIDRYGCVDTDGDGYSDEGDGFPNDPLRYIDTDGDQIEDSFDEFPYDPTQSADSDGDSYGDNPAGNRGDSCPTVYGNSTADRYGCIDSDGDGFSDEGDGFPYDPLRWIDNDRDGIEDQFDDFPYDPTQSADSDGDGYGDNRAGNRGDACPDEFGNSTSDRYGCLDTDGDGVSDKGDGFPFDPTRYIDTDGDGYEDSEDDFPFDPTQWLDSDEDGFGDNKFGSNGDKFPSDSTQWSDIDSDGYGDNPNGSNADAFIAEPSQWSDLDMDGCGDNPLGRFADKFPDDPTQCIDEDGDGFGDNLSGNNPDPFLFDQDNDGYNDSIDILPLLPSPGDLDNDGVPDTEDKFPSDPRESSDYDNDGIGDEADPDDDNDGYLDLAEINAGTDPFNSKSKPIDTFEIVLPGTAIGLGAWDLIGIFLGVPLTTWILIGLITRGGRAQKYEHRLREATRREDLEDIAMGYERAVMLRMLGPHQALRLERLRTELDDVLENQLQQELYDIPSPAPTSSPETYAEQEAAYEAVEQHGKKIPKI